MEKIRAMFKHETGKKTFPGGVHPTEIGVGKAQTTDVPTVDMPAPQRVVLPMSMHVGAPCRPVVKPGDNVLMGQLIGEPGGFVSAPIHSTVSGKVKAIESRFTPQGASVTVVIIENDGRDEWNPALTAREDIDVLDAKTLSDLVRAAGIVGLGGAGFPTSVKLSPPPDKRIDYVIVNGAECEPHLTADTRTMMENAAEVIDGLRLCMKITGAKYGYVGVEDNKPGAIAALKTAAEGSDIIIEELETKYPQGGEKQLIQAITGREVPSGGLPMDAGCVVVNAGTAYAISLALRTGRPLIDRVMTVTGAVSEGMNLRVRVGTPVSDVLSFAGITADAVKRAILGGPMMGFAIYDFNTPVTKGTSGILLQDDRTKPAIEANCIRCGRCAEACPVRLIPLEINRAAVNAKWAICEEFNVMDCIECGACSFICPARRHLTQSFRMAKREILKSRLKKK